MNAKEVDSVFFRGAKPSIDGFLRFPRIGGRVGDMSKAVICLDFSFNKQHLPSKEMKPSIKADVTYRHRNLAS